MQYDVNDGSSFRGCTISPQFWLNENGLHPHPIALMQINDDAVYLVRTQFSTDGIPMVPP